MEHKKTAKIALGFILAVFLLPSHVFALTFYGPTGTRFTDNTDTTSGGGVLRDVILNDPTTSFTVCSNRNGNVVGAWAVTAGIDYGIVDYGGGGGSEAILDGEWVIYQQHPSLGCVYASTPSFKGTFVSQDGFFSYNIATTTLLNSAFYNSQTASSTLASLNSRCSDTTNIFSEGLCMAGVFLFVPSNDSLGQFSSLKDLISTKFPFSYVASITTTWTGLVASSTANSPTYTMNYGSLGIGSTTPLGNILPNFDALSASTTKSYFPAGTFDLLKSLAGIAIILTLLADIFFTSRNLIHK